MWGKGQSSSLQEGVSHTYTLRLGQSRNSILYKKKLFLSWEYFNSLCIEYVTWQNLIFFHIRSLILYMYIDWFVYFTKKKKKKPHIVEKIETLLSLSLPYLSSKNNFLFLCFTHYFPSPHREDPWAKIIKFLYNIV